MLFCWLSGDYDDFQSILEQTKIVLEEWRNSGNKKVAQQWGQRMQRLDESWKEKREDLFKAVLSNLSSTQDGMCKHCHMNSAVVRCHSCKPNDLCYLCDQTLHVKSPLHDRDAYVNGHMKPIPPTMGVNENGDIITISKFNFFYVMSNCYSLI